MSALGPWEGGLALERVGERGWIHTGAAVVGVENELVGGHDGGCDGQSVAVMVTSAGFVNVRKTQVVVSSICISFGDPLFLYPLQCPPLMRRIHGTLHHRWRMALFGAIQLPSRLGRFQSRAEARYAARGTMPTHSLIHIKRGEGREGGVKCVRGSGWEWCRNRHPHLGFPISFFSNPTLA